MNKFTLVGTVTKDIIFGNGDIKRPTIISLAVEHRYQSDKDDFFEIVTWNDVAIHACRIGKGSYIEVEGILVPNSYEKDGKRIYTLQPQAQYIHVPRKVKGAYKKPSDEVIAQNEPLIAQYKSSKKQQNANTINQNGNNNSANGNSQYQANMNGNGYPTEYPMEYPVEYPMD